MPLSITAECRVFLSEDSGKVINAVKNILVDCEPTIIDNKVLAESKKVKSLAKIYEHVRSRAILGVFRRILEYNTFLSSTWFNLNKQAAYAGIVSICEEESESPLGPIRITITSNQLPLIINWLIS